MFKKLNMCFTKTCTAYKHQHDPTRVMVTDSQAPVGLIFFWVSGRWTLLARSQGSLQDSYGFFKIFTSSKHLNMIQFCRFNPV